MLVRATTEVYPRLHHISLGATSRYAIVAESGEVTLSDPGCSAHFPALLRRLEASKLSLSQVKRVLVTHLDADRVGMIPLLRRELPKLQVVGNSPMMALLKSGDDMKAIWEGDRALSAQLSDAADTASLKEFSASLSLDKGLVDGESLAIDDDISIRCVSMAGHRQHSQAYLVQPHNFLIADETVGYYNGRRLAAPGGDASIQLALESISRLADLDLSGVGFSYGGCITGSLVRKHLESVSQNTSDLLAESRRALAEGLAPEEVKAQVREAFFLPALRDPCLIASLSGTLDAIWRQVSA